MQIRSEVSLLSITTPRVPRELHEDTSEPALLTEGRAGRNRRRWCEPNSVASDLRGFKARPLQLKESKSSLQYG
jgi:hypothetical protein